MAAEYIVMENDLGEQACEALSRKFIDRQLQYIEFDDNNGRPRTNRNLVICGDMHKLSLMMITTSVATWLALYNKDNLIQAEAVHSRDELYSVAAHLLKRYCDYADKKKKGAH